MNTVPSLTCSKASEILLLRTLTECLQSIPKSRRYRAIVKTVDRIQTTDEIEVFEACYDDETKNTYYTKHTIHENSNQKKLRDNRKGWNDSKMHRSFYLREGVKSILNHGHFTPLKDFPHVVQQAETMKVENTAPQAVSVNAGNWKSVEEEVRNYAHEKSKTLTIWTGGYGIRSIWQNNISVNFCADLRKYCVPQYYWKVVKDNDNNAIAFVTVNDVVNNVPRLCTDICTTAGWTFNNINVANGFTICCQVADLIASRIPEFPNFGTAAKVLNRT